MSVKGLPSLADTYDLSECETASRFVTGHPNLRWCQTRHKWLFFDGKLWVQDKTVRVFSMIRDFCITTSASLARDAKDWKAIQSAKYIAAVEKLAKSDRAYAAEPDQFDCDDWLLNTPDGLVNLRTGDIRAAEPEDYCTQITAAAAVGDCGKWMEFLGDVTDGDVELMDYLQRMVGYFLTGSTREHSLHFLYGTGGNGKSVFMETIAGVLGDYARYAPMETFTESRHDRHPTELAMLQGARLVLAQETEQGKRWAQSRIKALTGGDRVPARFMRQDFFEYKPKFKLCIAGNTKPKLDTVDEAMRRRFHVVPFTVQIPEQDRDTELTDKLKHEWPGILKWAVSGCLEYQRIGLAAPEKVIAATNAYLESQDVFREWITTECETGPDYWETPKILFGSWRQYADSCRERVGRQTEFAERMEGAGFQRNRDYQRGRFWDGIKVKNLLIESRYD